MKYNVRAVRTEYREWLTTIEAGSQEQADELARDLVNDHNFLDNTMFAAEEDVHVWEAPKG